MFVDKIQFNNFYLGPWFIDIDRNYYYRPINDDKNNLVGFIMNKSRDLCEISTRFIYHPSFIFNPTNQEHQNFKIRQFIIDNYEKLYGITIIKLDTNDDHLLINHRKIFDNNLIRLSKLCILL